MGNAGINLRLSTRRHSFEGVKKISLLKTKKSDSTFLIPADFRERICFGVFPQTSRFCPSGVGNW